MARLDVARAKLLDPRGVGNYRLHSPPLSTAHGTARLRLPGFREKAFQEAEGAGVLRVRALAHDYARDQAGKGVAIAAGNDLLLAAPLAGARP